MSTGREEILRRIEMLEAELGELKRLLASEGTKAGVPSRGTGKDGEITDEQTEEARLAWSKPAGDIEL